MRKKQRNISTKGTVYVICCGKKFYTNKTNRVICSDYDCEEKMRIERLQTNRARYRANAKQKRAK